MGTVLVPVIRLRKRPVFVLRPCLRLTTLTTQRRPSLTTLTTTKRSRAPPLVCRVVLSSTPRPKRNYLAAATRLWWIPVVRGVLSGGSAVLA